MQCSSYIFGYIPGHFGQHVADNVDHNLRTLDGMNTFHGMGIIAAITSGTKGSGNSQRDIGSGSNDDTLLQITASDYKHVDI